jgi:hypothetical protein
VKEELAMSQIREFMVSDDLDEAVRKLKIILNRVGQTTRISPGQYVEGTIAFGVKPVKVLISWRPEEAVTKLDEVARGRAANAHLVGTMIVVEATAEDKSEVAERSAIERFEDAYLHFDRPDYKADRIGLLPFTIVGIMVIVVLLGILLWRIPAVRNHLPAVNPYYLKNDNEKQQEAAQEQKQKEELGETDSSSGASK